MSPPVPLGPPRVLLVDGDFRTSQRLAALLQEDGFCVDVVRDGASAIARLAEDPVPNILITELHVPSTDGITIARFARSRNPGIQLVVLTRHANQPLPPAFGTRPPVVLSKPLDYARLMELLVVGSPAVSEARVASHG
jgi:two-component system, NtrC family, nitrogen regulation response regulator GlnG